MGCAKMNKYNAKRHVIDGVNFSSIKEAKRYCELCILLKAGEIKSLQLQVPFELAPAVKFDDEQRKKPALRYFADFVYFDKVGNKIVEDVKGFETKEFRIKRHLMVTVHGIQVKIV